MKTKTIKWMADEAIGNTKPSDWEQVLRLTQALVNFVGNDAFEHEVVDPRVCWQSLVQKIHGKDFTTVIDLTGMFGEALRELFPSAAVIEDFHISRIRTISSHGLPTTGHTLSLTPDQIRRLKQNLDFKNVLIVDDTSFSGASSEVAMQTWGIIPENTTHAFLLANTGFFPGEEGFHVPGAVDRLKQTGASVLWGQEIHTPEEDGWHTKDLHDHPSVHSSFEIAILIQELTTNGNIDIINKLLRTQLVQEAISSERFTPHDLQRLQQEGRVHLAGEIQPNTVHARNPLLWAIPSFGEHISITNILQHKDEITLLLSELREFTQDPEGKRQAQEGFKKEASFITNNLEGVRAGGERL